MEGKEAELQIRQYLLDNYEFILSEALPLLDRREELLISHPHLQQDIKGQFKWAFGSILVELLNKNRSDIPGEDIQIFCRSLDIEHFLTLRIKND